ncbi:MAG: amine oxidase [Desulfobacteraceae bacterium]|nr:amine oxidase [Desulfobacteraceae bacterium]
MDQKTLRQVEKHCIQEEAPACRSACPLHMDVRTFVHQAGKGKWNDAWKTLNKTLPFPGILGRICDHPCENSCLRGGLGGAVRIGELEKVCVNQPKPRIRVIPMPKKSESMAVVGESLSSLVAALDLLRKGYDVTLFSSLDKLGGPLWELPDDTLPKDILEQELQILAALGLKVEKKKLGQGLLAPLREEFSAVYLGLDSPNGTRVANGKAPSEKTFALVTDGVFAGGALDEHGNLSTVLQCFQGRAAALSMERFVQKVSLMEGRGDEGPYPTRLFTNTEDIEPLPLVLPVNGEKGYTLDEARAEAQRCIQCQCLECLKVCPYLDHFKGYPKRYAREIYNNASIVMGNHAANLMVNTCSLCGLCQEICPENFSMADLCLDARRDLVERKKMPPSAHEFALQDMEFSNSEPFMLTKHAPDHEASRFAFFPGCQLSGSNPEHVLQTYSFLRDNWAKDTGLMLQCCAAPAHWSGDEPKTEDAIALLEKNWQKMGKPRMILACSSCLDMFRRYLSQIEILSLWEVMDQCELPSDADNSVGRTMAVHDPCTSRHEPRLQEAARSLAAKLGITLEELEFSREKTECCGFGGLMENVNPALAQKQLERRTAESDLDYLAYCAMCRESLRGAGKRTAHLLDFIFPRGKAGGDPADRARTGLSDSRENRVRLKKDILSRVWKEAPEEDGAAAMLHISPEVQANLDKRRILHSDIRAAIAHAEETGRKMQSRESGHFLACHRPLMVTFWVEYAVAENGYHIYNSYCHRMQIMGENA